MDLNFSNILEGTRQYFQGIPKPPTTDGSQLQDAEKAADISSKDERTVQDDLKKSEPPAMSDSRPPSEAAVQRNVPTPPVPFRPPSEPLLEPKPHIIHKATVMQQAQQMQQRLEQHFVNPSPVERPPSANMISPPSHIIHKPPQTPVEPPSAESVPAIKKPEMQPTNGIQSNVPSSKYSSHLPTPPQPSYTSSHLQIRTQTVSQPRSLTVLQPRQSRPTSAPYQGVSAPGSTNQKTLQIAGHSSEAFLTNTHLQYDAANTQYAERSQSANLNYSNIDHKSPSPVQAVQKHNRIPHSSSLVHEAQYQYHQQKYLEEKSAVTKSYPHMMQQHPSAPVSRALPNLSSQYDAAHRQPQQHQMYPQKVANHSVQAQQFVQHQYPRSATKLTEYSYPTKSAQHRSESIRSHHLPSPSMAYQERLSSVNGDHRRSQPGQPVYNHQVPSRSSTHDQPIQYSHQGATYSQAYHTKTVNDYPSSRSQHPGVQQYPPGMQQNSSSYPTSENVAPSPSAIAPMSRGQLHNYQAPPSARHSYEAIKYGTSPSSSSRNISSKQSIAMHQQRETVSVTSLVNQMNVMRQQVPRTEPVLSVPKHKKESPLDLSVKTVRTPADSTAQDDAENAIHERREMYSNHSRINAIREASNLQGALPTVPRHRSPSSKLSNASHKVDFLPNFTAPSVEKHPAQYRELNSYQYPQQQQQVYHNAVNSYHLKPERSFSNRFDTVSKSHSSHSYDRRESTLPKIDLTLAIDESEKQYRRNSQPTYHKEDLRKRSSSSVPVTIPQKLARHDSWSSERRDRPDLVNHPSMNNTKLHNGYLPNQNYHKAGDAYLYSKKSENVEPHLSKYYSLQHQQLHHNPDIYGHRGGAPHHYDYHMSERLRVTTHQESPAMYNHVMNSNNVHSTPADKRVLSILRNSLEAKNFSESAKISENSSDDCIIIHSDDNSTPPADFSDFQSKKAKHMIEHRQSMEAKKTENRQNTSNEVYKVSVPRAVDSIKHYDSQFSDQSSKPIKIREDLHDVPKNDHPTVQNSVDRSSGSYDPDIAARIRTKAELKGFTLPTAEPRNIPNTPSVIKETNPLGPNHKRLLFGKTTPPEETVVNLQNKTLDMSAEKSQTKKSKDTEPTEESVSEKQNEPEDEDPFWAETCESFVEQLKTGKTKKGRKKKIHVSDSDLMELEFMKSNTNEPYKEQPSNKIKHVFDPSSDEERLSVKKDKRRFSKTCRIDYSDNDDDEILKFTKINLQNISSEIKDVERELNLIKVKAEIVDNSYESEKVTQSKLSSQKTDSSKISESSDDEQLSVKREKKKLMKVQETHKNKTTETSKSKSTTEDFLTVKIKREVIDETYEPKENNLKDDKNKNCSNESSDDEQLSIKKEKKKSLNSSKSPIENDKKVKSKPSLNNNDKKSLKVKSKLTDTLEIRIKAEKITDFTISKMSKSNLTFPNVTSLQAQDKPSNKADESSDDEQLILKKKKKRVSKSFSSDVGLSDNDENSTLIKLKSKKNSINNNDKKMPKTPSKDTAKIKEEIMWNGKKPGFGDGSDFRPGWELEVYNYKRSLRMPTRLINVTRPPYITRVSSSLPDLDPYPHSPAPSTSTEELCSKKFAFGTKQDTDSDLESISSFYINQKIGYDSEASTHKKADNKGESSSILDVLIQRYSKQDDSKRKLKEEPNSLPKIIPKSTNPLELLATPSLSLEKNNLSPKKRDSSLSKEKVMEDMFYRGSFRKETVSSYRDTFISDTNGLLGATEEFSPVVIKSRTRTETRVLKQRATIKEVFGAERPASAPPVGCTKEEPTEPEVTEDKPAEESSIESSTKSSKLIPKKVFKKNKIHIVRQGLRSERLLKCNDAKGRLMRIRKRNSYLKSLQVKKLKSSLHNMVKPKKDDSTIQDDLSPDKNKDNVSATETAAVKPKLEKIDQPTDIEKPELITPENIKTEPEAPKPIAETNLLVKDPVNKRFKKLFTRRKFSSGFDYIRKKKKLIKKELMPKIKKRILVSRPSPESVQDIQKEIKSWIIQKSIGETVLHRASKLGYIDCVAYCLEKLDMPPSCRDNAGYTPLHEACTRNHLAIARLLLQYGANVSEAAQGGIRPLHEACESDNVELIRLLLSYGADPLLATYSGQTPISLSGNKAVRLIQLHLNDVQGNVPQPWRFEGPHVITTDHNDNGYDPLGNPPSPPSPPTGPNLEFITSTSPLPSLYRLASTSTPPPAENSENNNTDTGLWCLLQELANLLQIKSRDALLKQVHCGPGQPRDSLRELKMQDFLDRAQCQQLLSAGEKINIRASKIALVKYTEKVKQLLNVDTVMLR